MNRIVYCCFLFLQLFVVYNVTGQDKKKPIDQMTREDVMQMTTDQLLALPLQDLLVLANKLGVSIDELLKMQTSVASRTELTTRETPGIISVITADEIRKSGARDLTDVLKMVPGFDFGYDLDGVVGLGFRGGWVQEGKALILLDGQMMNDLVYYNTPFGNHFDVSQIKKIEIVRGPGSAIYGGNAELCVVNIITKSGEDIKGVTAGVSYGQLPKSIWRINGSLQLGNKTGKWDWALKGYIGRANRSDRIYVDNPDTITKTSFAQDLSKNGGKIESQNINLSLKREALIFQFVYDNYNTQYIADSAAYFNKFRNISSSIKYDFKVSDKLSITPTLSYQYSRPYDEPTVPLLYTGQRYKAGAGLSFDPSSKLNFIGGFEFYHDYGHVTDETLGNHNLNLNNGAVYAQMLWKLAGYNLVIGGRGENSNKFGSSFAPRVGITKVIKKFHFKVLASGAFRSPAIGNIDVSQGLKVEKTFVLETELGYKINDNMFITGNIYDVTVKNLIQYYDNGNDSAIPIVDWGYRNGATQGSDGFELEYRYKYIWGFSTINYSFFTNEWKSVPDYYAAPDRSKAVLGFPHHKFTYLAGFNVGSKVTVSPSLVVNSERLGLIYDADGNTVTKKYAPSVLLNLNVTVDNLLVKGLNFDFGVHDILNNAPKLIEPYDGGYPAYPGRSRELVARLMYQFKTN